MNLEKFPVLDYDNWNNLIIYALSIFNKSEIKQILKFNKNLDLLDELSKTLSEKEHEVNNDYENMLLGEFDDEDQWKIIQDHLIFEDLLNQTIYLRENIPNFSNNK